MKNRWPLRAVRPLLVRMVRRWGWAMGGVLAGASLMAGWQADVYEEHAQLEQQVKTLKTTTPAANPSAAMDAATARRLPASEALALVDRLPAVQDAPGLWLALQKGLQQQGLQVQSLRPQGLQEGMPLSSQAVAVRLQGRFPDVVSAWASLVDAGPVWTLDQLTVTAGGQAGQSQWDGLWRVWLRPDAAGAQAWPASWDTQVRRRSGSAVEPFAAQAAVAPVSSASEPAPVSADPRDWPLAQIRLWGVWQQDNSLQAVLGVGAHWAMLGPGARLALEGYRVKTIHPDAVALQSLKQPGVIQILHLQGVPQ
jgi:Tfp pilus assembly protein PilO